MRNYRKFLYFGVWSTVRFQKTQKDFSIIICSIRIHFTKGLSYLNLFFLPNGKGRHFRECLNIGRIPNAPIVSLYTDILQRTSECWAQSLRWTYMQQRVHSSFPDTFDNHLTSRCYCQGEVACRSQSSSSSGVTLKKLMDGSCFICNSRCELPPPTLLRSILISSGWRDVLIPDFFHTSLNEVQPGET